VGNNARGIMKVAFKIVNYYPESQHQVEQIEVKYCRQMAPKNIDDYYSVMVDCANLDFTDYGKFICSIMKSGFTSMRAQESEEPIMEGNVESKLEQSEKIPSIENHLNKVIVAEVDDLLSTILIEQLPVMDEIDLLEETDEPDLFKEVDETEL
jgi:hypothetical protein